MGFSHRIGAFGALFLTTATIAVHAQDSLSTAPPARDWQLNRLMVPTPSQLASEAKGQVFIYDSLEINQVNRAMDANFERIENMMFIRVHHPPEEEGEETFVEDDEC